MDLLAEGDALRKPCVYLTRKHGDLAGIWGGRCAITPDAPGRYRHWVTIDTRYIPGMASRGAVSLFTDHLGAGHVVFSQGVPPRVESGVELLATTGVSLPPLEAIFRLGSPAVQEWLGACGWDPRDAPTEAFPDQYPIEEYTERYQAQSPLYAGGAHAVLGGWHFPWPEGDWHDLLDATLLAWTFEDSEPWLELWSKGTRLWVEARST